MAMHVPGGGAAFVGEAKWREKFRHPNASSRQILTTCNGGECRLCTISSVEAISSFSYLNWVQNLNLEIRPVCECGYECRCVYVE